MIYKLKPLFCALLNVITTYLDYLDLQGKLCINLHFLLFIVFILAPAETQKPNTAGVWLHLTKCYSSTLVGAACCFCICQGELEGVEDGSNWPEVA